MHMIHLRLEDLGKNLRTEEDQRFVIVFLGTRVFDIALPRGVLVNLRQLFQLHSRPCGFRGF